MWAELCFVTSNAMHIGPLLLHRLEQQQMKETAANPEKPAKEPKLDKDGKVLVQFQKIDTMPDDKG